MLSPLRFSEALKVDMDALVSLADVSKRPDVSTGEVLQRYLRDSVRVIRAATDLAGSCNTALRWFTDHSLAAFGGRTPLELVGAGRTDDVVRYISMLEAGAAG